MGMKSYNLSLPMPGFFRIAKSRRDCKDRNTGLLMSPVICN